MICILRGISYINLHLFGETKESGCLSDPCVCFWFKSSPKVIMNMQWKSLLSVEVEATVNCSLESVPYYPQCFCSDSFMLLSGQKWTHLNVYWNSGNGIQLISHLGLLNTGMGLIVMVMNCEMYISVWCLLRGMGVHCHLKWPCSFHKA